MSDHTNPPFPPEQLPPSVPPTVQTKTETTTTTVETDTPHKGRRPGELLGMSGRFWVTMISLLGSTYIVVLVIKSEMDNQVKALTAGAYIAMAGSIASTYTGQNAGPTKPKPS